MLAVARSPDFKAIEDFDSRHKSSLEYVKMSKEFLSTWLGVPESIISDTPRDKCLDASEKHYIKSTQDEDAWLAFVIPTCFLWLNTDLTPQILCCSLTLRTSMTSPTSGLKF